MTSDIIMSVFFMCSTPFLFQGCASPGEGCGRDAPKGDSEINRIKHALHKFVDSHREDLIASGLGSTDLFDGPISQFDERWIIGRWVVERGGEGGYRATASIPTYKDENGEEALVISAILAKKVEGLVVTEWTAKLKLLMGPSSSGR